MAVTCIGIFLLAMALEFVRRVGKQYDRFILQQFHQQVNSTEAISDTDKNGCAEGQQACNQTATFRATPVQQLIRSVIRKSCSKLFLLAPARCSPNRILRLDYGSL